MLDVRDLRGVQEAAMKIQLLQVRPGEFGHGKERGRLEWQREGNARLVHPENDIGKTVPLVHSRHVVVVYENLCRETWVSSTSSEGKGGMARSS